MPKDVSQLRYTAAEVDQIKLLFPDLDSLKLLRKYLLDLPLTHDEIDRIQATWSPLSAREILRKVILPETSGTEAIGVGYDVLNNINISEQNLEYQGHRVALFVNAINYLNSRIAGLDLLPDSATGDGKWLTSFVLAGRLPKNDNRFAEVEDNCDEVLRQLVVKQNVEGILVGLNALISTPVETSEEAAARVRADSAN